MFSSHSHICQLAALLKAHGIKDGVLCPGSRNAPLTHTFTGAGIRPVGVTDERCAAFAAIGMSLAAGCQPVLVCVTSGTALLNTLPAVAEASERGLPLLIISADRPAHLIGQLRGQTLPQIGTLEPFAKTYNIDRAHTDEEYRHNNLLINEALNNLQRGPVHINVPIDEPLYDFTTYELPQERVVTDTTPIADNPIPAYVIDEIREATYPVVVCGQWERGGIEAAVRLHEENRALLLPDFLSNLPGNDLTTAYLYQQIEPAPQAIIHIGGNFTFPLCSYRDSFTVRIEEHPNRTPDTFQGLRHVVRCNTAAALKQLLRELPPNENVAEVRKQLEDYAKSFYMDEPTSWSVSCILSHALNSLRNQEVSSLHLANSLAVRIAAQSLPSGLVPTFCNRGVNGIEGSMSVAWGYSQRAQSPTLFLTGDLSFFYDSNALWNDAPSDLRILLVNDGGGMILKQKDGVQRSCASYLISGTHTATAEGLCKSFGVDYKKAGESKWHSESIIYDFACEEMQWLLAPADTPKPRPRLLELFLAWKLK